MMEVMEELVEKRGDGVMEEVMEEVVKDTINFNNEIIYNNVNIF